MYGEIPSVSPRFSSRINIIRHEFFLSTGQKLAKSDEERVS